MRTKNKLLVLMEVAVVLCAVLLLALPGLAADQPAQKVSVLTTASEGDFVLGVYGNANEDDTIDMRDYLRKVDLLRQETRDGVSRCEIRW